MLCILQSKIVGKLKSVFGSKLVFFWNDINGNRLGVVYRPAFNQPSHFNILESQFRDIAGSRAAGNDGKKNNEDYVIPNYIEVAHQIIELSNHMLALEKITALH
jgi:hypothetical protein